MSVKLHGREIEETEIYYVYFPDNNLNNIQDQKFKEYQWLKTLPDIPSKYDKLNALNRDMNPNVCRMKGADIVDVCRTYFYIPVYDVNFTVTKSLTLMPAEAMDYFQQYRRMSRKTQN
jgi:hypothetical protein